MRSCVEKGGLENFRHCCQMDFHILSTSSDFFLTVFLLSALGVFQESGPSAPLLNSKAEPCC